jgi:hypothetical protein
VIRCNPNLFVGRSGSGQVDRSGKARFFISQSTMSLSNKLSITDLDLDKKRVLIRVDFNVPLEDGKVTNPAVCPLPSHIALF